MIIFEIDTRNANFLCIQTKFHIWNLYDLKTFQIWQWMKSYYVSIVPFSMLNLKIGLMASNCRWMVRRRVKEDCAKNQNVSIKVEQCSFFMRTVWRFVSNKMLYRHNLDCLISSCDVRFMTKINVLLQRANQNILLIKKVNDIIE